MAGNDRDRWRDDRDRQDRERIEQVRHAYGPEEHHNLPDWQRDDIGAEGSGQAFAGNEGRGFGYGSDYRGDYGGRGFGGGDDYGHRTNVRSGSRDRTSGDVPSRSSDSAAGSGTATYRGRGPKGYRRSDERIKEDVSDRLAEDRYVDASDIEVAVENGEVTLSGSVDDRQARRRAEDLAEQVSGVSHVQVHLRTKGSLGREAGLVSAATPQAQGRLPGSGQTPDPSAEKGAGTSSSDNGSTDRQGAPDFWSRRLLSAVAAGT